MGRLHDLKVDALVVSDLNRILSTGSVVDRKHKPEHYLRNYEITQRQAMKGEPVYYRITGRDARKAAQRIKNLYETHQVSPSEPANYPEGWDEGETRRQLEGTGKIGRVLAGEVERNG